MDLAQDRGSEQCSILNPEFLSEKTARTRTTAVPWIKSSESGIEHWSDPGNKLKTGNSLGPGIASLIFAGLAGLQGEDERVHDDSWRQSRGGNRAGCGARHVFRPRLRESLPTLS